MKAAIYVRYSTDHQDASTLESQERVCRELAGVRGLDVVTVYSDAAMSGTHLERPGLQRLVADAKARKFRKVIIPNLARLSRDMVDRGWLMRQLEDYGVTVVDAKSGYESDQPMFKFIGIIDDIGNDHQVQAVSQDTHRQLKDRALGGFHAGGRAYGYSSIEEPNPTNPRNPRRLSVIDKAEAAVVRRCFELAAAGSSPRQIAHALNGDGVAAPHDGGKGFKTGHGWSHTTIRSMLGNKRYLGQVVWNAYRWKKRGLNRKRRVREARPESEHVIQHHPELAIIETALWERVQARTGRRQGAKGKGRPKGSGVARHMLSGLLRCGSCDGTFGIVNTKKVEGVTVRKLGCVNAKDRGPAICTNTKTIKESTVMASLVTYLRKSMANPERLKVFVDAFKAKFAALEASNVDPVAELDAKLVKQRQVIANVTQALVNVPGSKALGERMAVEEKTLADLEEQRDQLQEQRPKVLAHPAAIARFVVQLAETLEAGDMSQAGDALRSALAPFSMYPEAQGYRMSGALNLGVTEKSSSGGVLPTSSSSWAPIELLAA